MAKLRPTLITHNHSRCQITPSTLAHLFVLILARMENIYTFRWFWEEVVTQNGKAANRVQDARMKMEGCNAGPVGSQSQGQRRVKGWIRTEESCISACLTFHMKYPCCLSILFFPYCYLILLSNLQDLANFTPFLQTYVSCETQKDLKLNSAGGERRNQTAENIRLKTSSSLCYIQSTRCSATSLSTEANE